MSDEESHDYYAARHEAAESARQERIQARLDRFFRERPPAFAKPGVLHPDVELWTKRFLDGDPAGLILVGNVGVGKSWTLWKVKETLIRSCWLASVEIRSAHELKRITAPPVDEKAFKALAVASLLALDDIGSIRVSDWDADNLMALIDERWQFQRPTILASNANKLRDLLGERVASRLADGATLVKMTGPDQRRAQ